MNDHEIAERLRVEGDAGTAIDLDTVSIIGKGRARRTRRRFGGVATVAVLLLAPSIAWTLQAQNAGEGSRTRTVAQSAKQTEPPRFTSLAPACPPDGPSLRSRPTLDSGPINKPLVARVGDGVTLWAAIPKAPSDRNLTSVRFIVGSPDISPVLDADAILKPENQVAPPALVNAPAQQIAAEITLPTTIRPGNYPIFAYSTWPGPSLCGVANDLNLNQEGDSLARVGTLTVIAK